MVPQSTIVVVLVFGTSLAVKVKMYNGFYSDTMTVTTLACGKVNLRRFAS